jgi:hypothetical protein
MGLLREGIIATAILLAIAAIIAGYEHNADLATKCFSGMLFLIIAESILKIREQGESILRISVGMILGILVCYFIMPIPGIGILIGPLLGGFVVALFAGFKAGWDLLPTTLVTALFVSVAMKKEFVFSVLGHILKFLGSYDTLVDFIGTGITFGILVACVFLWVYLMIFCGIGALIGAFFHPSALPKNLRSQAKELDEQYKRAKTPEEKEKIKQQAKELARKGKKIGGD